MHTIEVPYGKGFVKARINNTIRSCRLAPKTIPPSGDAKSEILKALERPVTHKGLGDLRTFQDAGDVVIVVSDQTRPVPNNLLLDALLFKLEEYNIDGKQVTVVVGGGLHTPGRVEDIIGKDIIGRVRNVVYHDAMNERELIYLGDTSRGTPIWVNKYYALAEKRVVTGMIEPHQFVGYSGGAKGVAIGLGGAKTIEANHSLMTAKGAGLGVLEGNPVREDIDEIGAVVGIDLLVNVILDHGRRLVKAVAGHWFRAHREGVKFVQRMAQVKVPFLADVVIASPGGHPRDINVYQAQKALAVAEMVSKPGGVIILVAECPLGLGDDVFEETLKAFSSPDEVIDYFKKSPFRIGVHKAYLWAKTVAKRRVILVSDRLNSKIADILKVNLVSDLETALIKAIQLTDGNELLILPHAASIVPVRDQRLHT